MKMKRSIVMLLGALLALQCACGSTAPAAETAETSAEGSGQVLSERLPASAPVTTEQPAVTPAQTAEQSAAAETPAESAVEPAENTPPAESGDPSPASTDIPQVTSETIPQPTPGTTTGAVGADLPPADTPEMPAATPAVFAEPAPDADTDGPELMPEVDKKSVAMGYIGQSTSALFAAIGGPVSSDYAPSCLGDGEDGNLYYDGFTVYTYRENGTEVISYVE